MAEQKGKRMNPLVNTQEEYYSAEQLTDVELQEFLMQVSIAV